MEFEYFRTTQFEDSINIDSIGNCCLQAFTDDNEEYILMITTDLGYSLVKKFGPFKADIGDTGDTNFSYRRFSMEYKESKLFNIINDFLNKTSDGNITQVFEIPFEVAQDKLNSIKF